MKRVVVSGAALWLFSVLAVGIRTVEKTVRGWVITAVRATIALATVLIALMGLLIGNAWIVLIGVVGFTVVWDLSIARSGRIDRLLRRLSKVGPVAFSEEIRRDLQERTIRLQHETFELRLNGAKYALGVLDGLPKKLDLARFRFAAQMVRCGCGDVVGRPGDLDTLPANFDRRTEGKPEIVLATARDLETKIERYTRANEIGVELRRKLESPGDAGVLDNVHRVVAGYELLQGVLPDEPGFSEWFTLRALLEIRLEDERRGISTLYAGTNACPDSYHLLVFLATITAEGFKHYETAKPYWIRSVHLIEARRMELDADWAKLQEEDSNVEFLEDWRTLYEGTEDSEGLADWLRGGAVSIKNNAAFTLALVGDRRDGPRALMWAREAHRSDADLPEEKRKPSFMDTLGFVHLRYGLIEEDWNRLRRAKALFERAYTLADAAGRERLAKAALQHLDDTVRLLD